MFICLHFLNMRRQKTRLLYTTLVLFILFAVHRLTGQDDPVLQLDEMTSVLDGRDVTKEAIYFTETSGNGRITARFVCAVESAARLHPRADVYLLISYAPSRGLSLSSNEALAAVLQKYNSVKVLSVDMQKLFENSPLQKDFWDEKLSKSKYLAEHTSDVIRTITVWKYGGKYFDLDLILHKSFEGLHRFVIHESSFSLPNIASGIFGFEKNDKLGKLVLKMINDDFNGYERGHNGPWAFTRAMILYCKTLVPLMTSEKCKGFTFLKYHTIFPLEFYELKLYFNETTSDATMARLQKVEDLAGFHVGNNLIRKEVVRVGSRQPLALIAQQHCPYSYATCHHEF